MKNTLKLLGIITLLVVIGFSMAACGGDDGDDGDGGGGGDSGSNKPESIQYAGTYVYIWFDTYGTVWWDGSSDDLNREFTLTIDGNAVEIYQCYYGDGGIRLYIPDYRAESGKTYKIKVVYKASSANHLYVDFMGKHIPVKSFTIEDNVIGI